MTPVKITETKTGYKVRVKKQYRQPAIEFELTESEMELFKTEFVQAWWRKKKDYETELMKPAYNPETYLNFSIDSLNPELNLIENLYRPKGWTNNHKQA